MWFAIADAAQFGVALKPENGREITRLCAMIRAAAAEQLPVAHPQNPALQNVSISQLSAPPTHPQAHRQNATTVATGPVDWDRPQTWTGALDRSPCGTGTCARMATLHARGELGLHEDFVHESILGTLFTGRLIEETQVEPYRAVVPTLSGQGWITGIANYVLDPTDPFPEGFTVGDIWA
jgi:proline racemase